MKEAVRLQHDSALVLNSDQSSAVTHRDTPSVLCTWQEQQQSFLTYTHCHQLPLLAGGSDTLRSPIVWQDLTPQTAFA